MSQTRPIEEQRRCSALRKNQKVSSFSVPESNLCIFFICLKIIVKAITQANILKYKVCSKIGINEIATISIMAHIDRKSTRLNSSHVAISYAVFCLKKKKQKREKSTQKKKKRTRQE